MKWNLHKISLLMKFLRLKVYDRLNNYLAFTPHQSYIIHFDFLFQVIKNKNESAVETTAKLSSMQEQAVNGSTAEKKKKKKKKKKQTSAQTAAKRAEEVGGQCALFTAILATILIFVWIPFRPRTVRLSNKFDILLCFHTKKIILSIRDADSIYCSFYIYFLTPHFGQITKLHMNFRELHKFFSYL